MVLSWWLSWWSWWWWCVADCDVVLKALIIIIIIMILMCLFLIESLPFFGLLVVVRFLVLHRRPFGTFMVLLILCGCFVILLILLCGSLLILHFPPAISIFRTSDIQGHVFQLVFQQGSRQRGIGPSGIDEIPLALWRLRGISEDDLRGRQGSFQAHLLVTFQLKVAHLLINEVGIRRRELHQPIALAAGRQRALGNRGQIQDLLGNGAAFAVHRSTTRKVVGHRAIVA